jgi:hypothetical protein
LKKAVSATGDTHPCWSWRIPLVAWRNNASRLVDELNDAFNNGGVETTLLSRVEPVTVTSSPRVSLSLSLSLALARTLSQCSIGDTEYAVISGNWLDYQPRQAGKEAQIGRQREFLLPQTWAAIQSQTTEDAAPEELAYVAR